MAKCQSGKNIALLVGINYSTIRLRVWPQLKGCYNDVYAVQKTLVNVFGFDPNDIEVMTDRPGTIETHWPTAANIKSAIRRLISQLREGDVLFVHFSGHGTKVRKHHRQVEAIIACDANLLKNMDFRELVNRVPKGATFMYFSDSCHSGGLIDKEKEQIGPNASTRGCTTQTYNRRFVPQETVMAAILETFPMSRGHNNTHPDIDTIMLNAFGDDASLLFKSTRGRLPHSLKPDQGILLSACQSDELAGEIIIDGVTYGAFTYAVQDIIKEKLIPQPFTNKQLVMKAREIMPRILKLKEGKVCKQHPCLYCSDDNVNRTFLVKKTSRSEQVIPDDSDDDSSASEDEYNFKV